MDKNPVSLEEVENSINNIIKTIKEKNLTSNIENHENIIYLEFYNLITENIQYQKNITFIFHTISRAIATSEKEEEKESLLKLLPEFFLPFKNDISKTFPFISRILTTIQSNIHSKINPEYISKIFKDIILFLFSIDENNIEASVNKQNYEICQGFCIYNMKQNDELCQICGVLCLKQLIINLNFYLKNTKYMKYLWEKLILFIENDNFGCKLILLQCFNELIKKCKEKFRQYANITMYKVLDYLKDTENESRKEALNILYLLILNCPKDISALKNQLIDFISVLQEQNDEFIQERCNQILNLLNDNEKLNESSKILSSDGQRNESENNIIKNKINKMKKNVKNINSNTFDKNIPINNNLTSNQRPNKYLKKEKESIFKTPKNKEFFDKVNQIEDIYIVDALHNPNFKPLNTIENDDENQNEQSIKFDRKMSKEYSNNNNISYSPSNKNNNIINNYNNNTNDKNNYIQSDSNPIDSPSKNIKNYNNEDKLSYDDYSQLIQKMADLSEKQVFLIDCITQLKNDFIKATSDLNDRVDRLEKMIPNVTPNFTNQSVNVFNSNFNNDPIEKLIDENNLIGVLNDLNKLNFDDLNEISNKTLENSIYYFINKIQNENEHNIPLDKIISMIKKMMIGCKNKISNKCIENLDHTLKILLNDENMKEDNVIEIKLILSYLKK